MHVLAAALLLAAAAPPAGAPLRLWPGRAPASVGDTPADTPHLHPFPAPADSANGAAVVICPGGGYGTLANDHEGKQVAAFFNGLGVHAFVLQYRVATKERPGPLAPAPREDVLRALRTVRTKAEEWGIDPKRVGLMGFSAGGHLASTGGTQFGKPDPTAADPIDRAGSRPDFLILGYPVISMEDGTTHAGSRKNLLGANPTREQLVEYSSELRVSAETPPTFLFHTDADAAVLSENSVKFYLALRKMKVPAELHIFEQGKHGVGINPKTGSAGTDGWRGRLADWLAGRGVLARRGPFGE